ncbi:hypothetical protein [Dawidia soli]|uniref:Uncharacterized protein n=1 Tax=Dawidia soli TaxID=2782352 RepID=A0AAP2DES7_9BACT|nr:hypothetical protein [Dawidia soli]MBT1690478.1 hypothetical protein [Dawidia soli]
MAPISRKNKLCIYRMLSLLMLPLYLAGAGSREVLHAWIHTHEAVVDHSAAQEQDPCHRMLFHGEATACEHDAHLVDSDDCPLCDIACHVDQVMTPEAVFLCAPYGPGCFSCYKQRLDSYWAVLSSSRAPPAQA